MNIIDEIAKAISPKWAFSRARFRTAHAAYEAAKPGRLRKSGADNSSGDALTSMSGAALRGYARQLEQNYDIAKGILDTLVNNIIGAHGISVEFMPRDKDGNIHTEFANDLLFAYKDWILNPEVTCEHDWASSQRISGRTWLRDGEMLTQMLAGPVAGLNHVSRVPFSLELIEADHMPFDYNDENKGITQGVERNAWGKPVAYHVFKVHPGGNTYNYNQTTKRISADNVLHPKITSRLRQARGVTILASVIRRLEDIKDYEESERVAARIAAAFTGYIKKGAAEDFDKSDSADKDRKFKLQPGMVFDNLQPGEEVGMIESNRPSSAVGPFLEIQKRAVASGVGGTYSSISKNYNGTYSAQRQELVEGWTGYSSATMLFVNQFVRPIVRRFINTAIASGIVTVPKDVNRMTIYDADYRGPSMPWINPKDEVAANEALERAGYKSAQMTIRERGGNPEEVRKQIKAWREENDSEGLIFTTDAKHDKGPALELVPIDDSRETNKPKEEDDDAE